MTTYWCNPSWTITASSNVDEGPFAPKCPFAIIGGSSACDVTLPSKHLEPAVYFACVINGSIELWPLSAIAFARWGVMKSGEEFRVGKHRLSICLDQMDAEGANGMSRSDGSSGDGLTLTIKGKAVQKALKRAVTIVGSGHPSTLRLYGEGIACCDHAIIKVGSRIWLIDLVFDSMTSSDSQSGGESDVSLIVNSSGLESSKRAVELRGDGSYYQIGSMKLSLGEPQFEMGESTERRRLIEARAAQMTSPLSPKAGVDARAYEPIPSIASAVASDSQTPVLESQGGSSPGSLASDQSKSIEAKRPRPSDLIDPDSMTSDLTGKLVTRGQNRVLLRRIVMAAVIIVLGCLAILAVFSLFSRLIEVG